MPPVWRVCGQHADKLTDRVVIRLHGTDRETMDERSGKDWSKIVEARGRMDEAKLVALLAEIAKAAQKIEL